MLALILSAFGGGLFLVPVIFFGGALVFGYKAWQLKSFNPFINGYALYSFICLAAAIISIIAINSDK